MDLSQLMAMLMSGQTQQNAMLNAQTSGFGNAGMDATLDAMDYANPVGMRQQKIMKRGMENFENPQSPMGALGAMMMQRGQQQPPQMGPRQPFQPVQMPSPRQMPGPVQTGPGAGVMTPQEIEMIKMMMQQGYKF